MITAVTNTINGSNLNNALIEQTIRAVLYAISNEDMIYEISFNIKHKRIIIHVFRTADGQQIGDTRCPAKVQRTITTQDGQTLVVGYEDEAVQMFFIIH
ncbi:unnamed protein product [Rotaria sp. Silwood2]|nr:unnamed protein product [Rotaria sp. Silwood2]CAF2516110.1 unnamed protein product [Rotaria sp. Silwood2]CAF2751278.1 unnamed protein product [Rotaria sp. Silwood2]CAF3051192.1 unnamed protein product [Rotaria sp. Silwood2]CAF4155171.1 unnamed protein product [Rotaria sp. Silwood2]